MSALAHLRDTAITGAPVRERPRVTHAAMMTALDRIWDTDDIPGLLTVEGEIRATHPNDPEAETIARLAAIKRRRLVREA